MSLKDENEKFDVKCDICKQVKDFRVIKRNNKDYVVCKECESKIPKEEIKQQEAPKQEINTISTDEQMKLEKKKFEGKQRRLEDNTIKKEKEMVDMAIRSKSRTLFGGRENTLF